MLKDRKTHIDEARHHFENLLARSAPEAGNAGRGYLRTLDEYLEAVELSAAKDPRLAGVDTTGQLRELEEYAEWARQERERVEELLRGLF